MMTSCFSSPSKSSCGSVKKSKETILISEMKKCRLDTMENSGQKDQEEEESSSFSSSPLLIPKKCASVPVIHAAEKETEEMILWHSCDEEEDQEDKNSLPRWSLSSSSSSFCHHPPIHNDADLQLQDSDEDASSSSSSSVSSWFSVEGTDLSFDDARRLNPRSILKFAWNKNKELYFCILNDLSDTRTDPDLDVAQAWVYHETAQNLWPQLVIDFYIRHLKFSKSTLPTSDQEETENVVTERHDDNNNDVINSDYRKSIVNYEEKAEETSQDLSLIENFDKNRLKPKEIVHMIRKRGVVQAIVLCQNGNENEFVLLPLENLRVEHHNLVLDFLSDCLNLIDDENSNFSESEVFNQSSSTDI